MKWWEHPVFLFVWRQANLLTGKNVKGKLSAKPREAVAALVRPLLGNPMADWHDSQLVLSLLTLSSDLIPEPIIRGKSPTSSLVGRLTELPWPAVLLWRLCWQTSAVMRRTGLTWLAWRYRCRPSPTPSPCQGPQRNGAPAACAPSQSEG